MKKSQKSPDVFFLHLGERLCKTAGFSRNLTNLEILYGKLFNKTEERTIQELIERAKEEAAAIGQPAVTSPPKA